MTRDQKIADIRAACIKASPEIRELCTNCQERLENGKHKYGPTRIGTIGCSEKHVHFRPIRLADVLLAIDKNDEVVVNVDTEGVFAYWKSPPKGGGNYRRGATWNLRKDDLTQQSDECISFLAELLK
jgi:hypothetical protein